MARMQDLAPSGNTLDTDIVAVKQAGNTTETRTTFVLVKTWIKNWITKVDVGLDQVDNTSDANKPISGATATGLSGKVDTQTGYALSKNDYTDGEKANLANQSGTNTGDQDLSGLITSDVGATGGKQILNHIVVTQAQYDAITPVAGTLYDIETV